jgi:hypothetical protein
MITMFCLRGIKDGSRKRSRAVKIFLSDFEVLFAHRTLDESSPIQEVKKTRKRQKHEKQSDRKRKRKNTPSN